jgi:hypothetical protein
MLIEAHLFNHAKEIKAEHISSIVFLAYFSYFEQNKSRLKASPCCLCVCESLT